MGYCDFNDESPPPHTTSLKPARSITHTETERVGLGGERDGERERWWEKVGNSEGRKMLDCDCPTTLTVTPDSSSVRVVTTWDLIELLQEELQLQAPSLACTQLQALEVIYYQNMV